MDPEFGYCKRGLSTTHVWIKLPGLKLHYYTVKELSKLASYVGTLLYRDRMANKHERIYYERVCVEVKLNHKLPKMIPVINEFDKEDV